MAEPYYTGDNVPLKFKVTDGLGDVIPTATKVVIYRPRHRALTEEADATIDGNTVSYLVPTTVTTGSGEYHAFFILNLPMGIRTYQMNFTVKDNPR